MSEADIAACLRVALRMPSTFRWVADWLFNNLRQTPFHLNLTLPPDALQNALALHARHNISIPPTFFTSTSPSAFPLPQPLKGCITTKAVDLIFVPAAQIESISVGYALGLGLPDDDGDELVSSNPFNPPFAARFAFDTALNDLLIVAHGDNPPVIGIIAMPGTRGIVRDQYTFAVPSADYGFACLPSTVLSMFSNVEYRLDPSTSATHAPHEGSNVCARQIFPEDGHQVQIACPSVSADLKGSPKNSLLLDLQCTPSHSRNSGRSPLLDAHHDASSFLSDLLDTRSEHLQSPRFNQTVKGSLLSISGTIGHLLDTLACESTEHKTWETKLNDTSTQEEWIMDRALPSSHLPWIVSSNGEVSDGAPISPRPDNSNTSSGAFSIERLARGVAALGAALRGKYYGPTVCMSSLHVLTGRYTSQFTGKITYAVQGIEETAMTLMKETFAQSYYLAVLAVAPDQKLIACIQDEAAKGKRNLRGIDAVDGTEEAGHFESFTALEGDGYPNTGGVALPRSAHPAGAWNLQPGASVARALGTSTSARSSANVAHEEGLPQGARSMAHRIAPAIEAESRLRSKTQDETVLQRQESEESKEARSARLETERKKRNRLSAARSNARKKEAMDAVRKEIAGNRRRMAELERRKRAVTSENERLRRLISERALRRPQVTKGQLEGP